MLKLALIAGAGSFIGGASRFLLARFLQHHLPGAFPWGTLGVNLLGCLLIGLISGFTARSAPEWRLFLATGIMGGFTTFSAFSNESMAMLREGQFLTAFAYIGISVAAGLALTAAGLLLSRSV
jgi:CrcB protein